MPLSLYPSVPIAHMNEGFVWPAIEAQFDSVFRQVRQLTTRGLRRFTVRHESITIQELDSLRLFFNQRKGKAERFEFEYTLTALRDPGFEIGSTVEWAFDTGASITTNPSEVRTGSKAAKITALNGTTRVISGLQKFPLFPGDQVTFSGYAKANNAAGAIGTLYVEYLTAADIFVSGGPTSGDVTLTTSYVQYAPTINTVPATVAYGKVFVRATGASTTGRELFFDDLSVKLRVPVRFAAEELQWEYQTGGTRFSLAVPLEEAP
jgi:hypothetical protein